MAYLSGRNTNAKRKKEEEFCFKISLQLNTIIKLIEYIFSENEYLTERNIRNLYRFTNMYNIEEAYTKEEDQITKEYFYLLKEVVKFQIEASSNNINDIYYHIQEVSGRNFISEETIDSVFFGEDGNGIEELSDKQILYWNNFIQDKLDFASFYCNLDKLQNIINEFKVPNSDESSLIPKSKELIYELNHSLISNTMNNENICNDFNMIDEGNAKKVIRSSLNYSLNPGNYLSTGYIALDKMLNGGLQSERCYLFLGAPKRFKSGTMLNICMNIATLCKNWKLKDPSKIPTIVYFTMENSMNETFERIFEYLGFKFDFEFYLDSNGKKIYKLSEKDIEYVYELIKEETYHRTGIALAIKYRPHKSVSTDFLYTIVEDLNLIGQEPIFIAQDYIKRIRSTMNYPDPRLELGEVVNEMCKFAKDLHIPVMTLSQINREGIRVIEQAMEANKKDIGKKLAASMIGESSLLVENADYVIITNREFDEVTNKYYQTFKIVAGRGKEEEGNHSDYFAQPFDENEIYQNFRIETDINYGKSIAVDRISNISDVDDTKIRDSSSDAVLKRIKKNNKSYIQRVKVEDSNNNDEEDDDTSSLTEIIDDDEDDVKF